MALLARRLDIEEIPVEYNFPMHLSETFEKFEFNNPKVLHYHDRLGDDGLLKPTGHPVVDKAVGEVNQLLQGGAEGPHNISPAPGAGGTPASAFHNLRYYRMNARRQEHLATLMLPIEGKTVLEIGAGVGDLTSFFLDRGCRVTSIEPRPENVSYFRSVYEKDRFWPNDRLRIVQCSIDGLADGRIVERHQIVCCCGTLYHLDDPQTALRIVGSCCSEILILETAVAYGSADDAVTFYEEDASDPTNSISGRACLPTRTWVVNRLREDFAYVYIPITQPAHEQFALDWRKRPAPEGRYRALFIAARAPIENSHLIEGIPPLQYRSVPQLGALGVRGSVAGVVSNTVFGPVAAFPSDLITRQLLDFGAHTRNELALLMHFVDEGDLVYDIGAHIGTFSIPLVAAVGATGRVIAVEPDPRHFELLLRNLQSRGFASDESPICAAITDVSGRYKLHEVAGNTGATYLLPEAEGEISTIWRLDDLHQRFGRPRRASVVKIDVEGMELAVLRSGEKLLNDDQPVLYLELVSHQLERYGATLDQIEEILRHRGYRFFRNAGERNSRHDRFELVELPNLAAGGAFFDLLAIAAADSKLDRALDAASSGEMAVERG